MDHPNVLPLRRHLVVGACSVILAFATSVASAAQPLPRSTPEAQGISSAALLDFITAADAEIDTFNSFMLVRHGNVVAEGWWTPYTAADPHVMFSLSKSFTSTAVGLAVADGKLSVDDQVLSFFPDEGPPQPTELLRAMRVRDLLTMSTGHHEEVIQDFPYDSPDSLPRLFLRLPVAHKPGTLFVYNTPATYMQSAIVQKVTGQSVLDFLKPRLFTPLGIENPTWEADAHGVSLGGFGLKIRTEDIAKFGQLYLQRGQWNGQQLVPAAWVDAATSRQVSNGSSPTSDWDQGYGYQFWRCRHGLYRGDGAFGQFCIVMPQHDAVVAITSGVRNMQAVMNLVWEKILPAFRPEPLPEDTAAHTRLREKLSQLVVRVPTGAPTSPLAAAVSGRRYAFPQNRLGIDSIALESDGANTTLHVRNADGDHSIRIAHGPWQRVGRTRFIAGLARRELAPGEQSVATSGAWTADDVFTARLCFYETPFYVTLQLRFSDEQLLLDTEYNAAFGPTTQPQLVGTRQP